MATTSLIAAKFRERYGVDATVIASAPGRVNLVGEHTDYNDGFVLPMAIERRVYVALGAHDSEVLSDIPEGAGLSSSAAVRVARLRAECAVQGAAWNPIDAAREAQAAEQAETGVQCGIMDQLASAASRAAHAMLLDCRTLEVRFVAMPAAVTVVVMDTGTRRTLTGTAYNERRASCEAAVRHLQAAHPGIRALRDVSTDMLTKAAASMDAVTLRRARHVVAENQRPAAMVDAFRAGDVGAAGQLMNDSHASLRALYEVSSDHLDIACDVAREHPGCLGARMTGAGFGGSAIALVRSDAGADFIRWAQPRYEAKTYQKSDFFVVHADDGARLEPLQPPTAVRRRQKK